MEFLRAVFWGENKNKNIIMLYNTNKRFSIAPTTDSILYDCWNGAVLTSLTHNNDNKVYLFFAFVSAPLFGVDGKVC